MCSKTEDKFVLTDDILDEMIEECRKGKEDLVESIKSITVKEG